MQLECKDYYEHKVGVVVTYTLAMRMPRVRFPDFVFKRELRFFPSFSCCVSSIYARRSNDPVREAGLALRAKIDMHFRYEPCTWLLRSWQQPKRF